jgi:hypothetical protein
VESLTGFFLNLYEQVIRVVLEKMFSHNWCLLKNASSSMATVICNCVSHLAVGATPKVSSGNCQAAKNSDENMLLI